MNDWIKLETNTLEDPRILALVEDYGMAGFGIYILLRSHIEAQSEHGLPLDYVLKKVSTLIRKNRTISILSDYDLFVEDEFGLIRACTLDPAYAMPAHRTPTHGTPTHETPTHGTPGHGTPGHEPTEVKETIREKKITDKSVTKKVFRKPTVTEVAEYCHQRNNGIDASRFCDFYESKGWMVGKTKMVDWKAAVRTWESKAKNESEEPDRPRPSTLTVQSGVQYFNGRPLPPDAPPRPSDTAEWDESSGTWMVIYG